MENTRLKELLEIVKENLINTDMLKQSGICKEAHLLWEYNKCTLAEKLEVIAYLKKNKPTIDNQYAIFTQNPYWTDTSVFWWMPIYSDIYQYSFHTKEIRINYLTELINNIK